MNGSEVSFYTDKYNKPKYLSKRESISQVIVNGLFMKPGNYPSDPNKGVDIEQYLLNPSDAINSSQLLSDIRYTCGDDIIGTSLVNLSFQMVNYSGMDIALILISVEIDGEDDQLAISLRKDKDVIRYQYSFINEAVPV